MELLERLRNEARVAAHGARAGCQLIETLVYRGLPPEEALKFIYWIDEYLHDTARRLRFKIEMQKEVTT